MYERRSRALVVGVTAALVWPLFAQAQGELSVKDVIEKNLQASGGREKLSRIKNISFRGGDALATASSFFELKIISGKGSVPSEIILVRGDDVRRLVSGQTASLAEIPKALNQTLARLYGGVFTLLGFEGRLELRGLKAFGPEKLYHLAAVAGTLEVGLYVGASDFFLKRLVLQGKTAEGDKYEINYDFSPFEDAEGIKVPLTWFRSQVGTRGTLVELSELKINQPLDREFFLKADAPDSQP